MQYKTLQMKRALRTAMLVLLLSVAWMGKGYAQTQVFSFDFSEVSPSGQTLWYKITDEANQYVMLVAPGYQWILDGIPQKPVYWKNYQRPVGNLVIPERVRGYSVVGLLCRSGDVYYDDGHYEELFEVGALFSCSGLTSVVIPSTITSIGTYAFSDCNNLESIDIPNSVTSIEYQAFSGCTSLTSVSIPSSVTSIGAYAFSGCSGLTSVNIPNSVTILTGTFEGCTSLTSIVIPSSVTTINGTFANCTSLTSVVIPNSVTHIGGTYNVQDYPGHYTTVWIGNTFGGCSSLTSIDIPNSVTYIGNGAFSSCSSLTSITIPFSVDTIGQEAFKDCTRLTEVKLYAKNCIFMGNGIFSGCSSLNTLEIGNQVQSIPNNVFKECNKIISLSYNATDCVAYVDYNSSVFNCAALTELNIGENVQTIPASAFKGCNKVMNLIIPNSVTSIGSNAFSGFNGTSITIPKSVASIGNCAFKGCSRLTTVYYNAENATGSSAFSNCANLTTIHIGADVHEIHPVFGGCSSVHLVVALGLTPAVLESNALADIAENSILMVSCGKRLTYFSVWNMFEFNNIMEDCSTYPVSMSNVGAGGSISASTTNAQMGEVVDLSVTPNAGMVLSSISVVNASDPTQIIPIMPVGKATSMYRFVMPPFGVSVEATFEHGDAYAVNISSSIIGGSVTASTTEALAGETVILTFSPNPGYELRSLTVCNANDASQTVNVTNNIFIMPAFDVMVSAIFDYTSVDENESGFVSIYPNPTNGQVKIEAENMKHITISNMLGQTIYDGNASGNAFEYDFSKHEAGIYLIRIETAHGVAVKKASVTR